MFELWLEGTDGPAPVGRVGVQTVYVGRGPHNDVIVTRDSTVSTRHAAFWEVGERLFVQDLSSRNGTWLDDRRVVGTEAMSDGVVIRLGTSTRVMVKRIHAEAPWMWALEDLSTGARWALRWERFRLGAGPNVDLMVQAPKDLVWTLLVGEAEVWLGHGDDANVLSPGEPFLVGGRPFCVRSIVVEATETADVDPARYPYRMRAAVQGRTARAEVEDSSTGKRCVIDAENRAVLLYLLGKRLQDDRLGGVRPEEVGWCDDDDLAVGIWGRAEASAHPGNLNVLLCRVRRELREAGLDPWFIERRRRQLRARVDAVELA